MAITAPADGALHRSTVTVSVEVADQDSVIDTVDLRVDGGAWSRATETGAGLYTLTLAGLSEGSHLLEARTLDSAGNEGQAQPVSFFVDLTPPVIQITGVEDGGVYGSAVTPIITVDDLHPVSTTLSLDGQPFASASLVDLAGEHVLRVSATDGAGNVAVVEMTFSIQGGDPELFATLTDSLVLDADGDGAPRPGDRLRYTLELYNLGAGAATSVALSVPPSPGALPVTGSTTTSHGVVDTEPSTFDALAISIGTLVAGETATVTWDVDVDPDLALDRTWIAAQARITSLEQADLFSDDPETEALGDRTVTPVQSLDTLRVHGRALRYPGCGLAAGPSG